MTPFPSDFSGSFPENQLHHIFGMDTSIKQSIFPASFENPNGNDPVELIYLAGKSIVKFNLKTKQRMYSLNNINDRCFGCMTVKDELIYFGEVGSGASILICNLSNLQILGTLNGGSDTGYTCLDVSKDGKRLCSISMRPDNIIIVWDLEKMTTMLKTQACGQDIFHVAFSPYDNSVITTSGKGHIKFWNIAKTFTGLKLNGRFGKFGKVDVSNIESFVHLSNGNIVSGSDSGILILWEDGFLKCIFVLGDEDDGGNINSENISIVPIHQGGVRHLHYDHDQNNILTSGGDGCIKWWNQSTFLGTDHNMEVAIQPLKVISFTDNGLKDIRYFYPFGINSIILHDVRGKVILKENGHNTPIFHVLWKFHGGKINSIDVSPREHLCITCGDDGMIYCCNYEKKKTIASIWFPLQCLQLVWCPKQIDSSERSFVVGFSDGSIKLCCIDRDRIVKLQSVRPHKRKIVLLKFKKNGSLLATGDDLGTVFIFRCKSIQLPEMILIPVGYIECKNMSAFQWCEDKEAFQYNDNDGTPKEVDLSLVLQLRIDDESRDDSTMSTYLLELEHKMVNEKSRIETGNSIEQIEMGVSFQSKIKSYDGKFSITADPLGFVKVLRRDPNQLKDVYSSKVGSLTSTFLPQFIFIPGDCEVPDIVSTDQSKHNEIHFDSSDVSEYDTLEEILTKRFKESRLAEAQEKKNKILQIISDLRTEFLSIRQLNSSLPESARLNSSEMSLDCCFENMYKRKLQQEIDKIAIDLQNEESKSAKMKYQKLKEIFEDNVEDSLHIVVGLKSGQKVQSFPLLQLDESFTRLRQLLYDDNQKAPRENDVGKEHIAESFTIEKNDNNSNVKNLDSETKQDICPSESKAENRKAMRMKRKIAIESKMKECPSDLTSTQLFENNIEEKLDNWALKSSNVYHVPFERQINMKSKLNDMVCCEEHIFGTKKAFNSKLLSLEKSKEMIEQNIKTKEDRVKEIQLILDKNDYIQILKSAYDEEMALEVSSKQNQNGKEEKYPLLSLFPRLRFSPKSSNVALEQLSKLEFDEIQERKASMLSEVKKLQRDINGMISEFDELVYVLAKERFQILLETKVLETKLFTMFQELELLQQFEGADKDLKDEMETIERDKLEIAESVQRYEKLLLSKQLEVESKIESEKILLNQFESLVQANNVNRDILRKIFLKRVKYYGDGDYISDDEDDESDESLYDSDEDVDLCPENCPSSTYDSVIQLRENRAKLENERKIIQRQYNNINHCHRQFHSKLRQLEKHLDDIKRKIQTFESEKLKSLNELNVVVPIMTSQIHVQNDNFKGTSGADESLQRDYTIFSRDDLMKLIQRSRDIVREKDKEEKMLQDLQADVKRRKKKNMNLEESIIKEKKRCEELQILKFGQTIDIDRLDELSETSTTLRKRAYHVELEMSAKRYERKMSDIELKNQELKKELKTLTETSTQILNELADLSDHQMIMERDKQNTKDEDEQNEDEESSEIEISNLKAMVLSQKAEMERLQQDISKLKRKDGKVKSYHRESDDDFS